MLLKPAAASLAALVLFLAASHHGGSLTPRASAQEKKAAPTLVGKWLVTGVEYRGKDDPPERWYQQGWTFTEKTAVLSVRGRDDKEDRKLTYKYTTDTRKDPAHLTLTNTDGSGGFLCVYKIEKGTDGAESLTISWCICNPSAA